MANNIEYGDLLAFHPGYYVAEIIEDMEITQEEFALRLGTSAKNVSELVNGKTPLSNDIAMKLSNMLGTSIDLWLNLQKEYEKKIIQINQIKELDEQKSIVSMIDYNYFVALGVVAKARTLTEKINNLRSYFKVASLNVIAKKDFLVNYRTTGKYTEKNLINSKIWLQTAINIGMNTEVNKFNANKLKMHISEIRLMTTKEPNEFLPRLKDIFEECGVTFVILPYLKNSNIHGAVKWINSAKVILAINDRNKDADIFWFSLFHEIKHILQQKHKTLFVSGFGFNLETLDCELEREADEFARDTLIPKKPYDDFVKNKCFSELTIREFAKEINVHPGIVLGRLQHDKIIEQNRYNTIKEKYQIIFN